MEWTIRREADINLVRFMRRADKARAAPGVIQSTSAVTTPNFIAPIVYYACISPVRPHGAETVIYTVGGLTQVSTQTIDER
jgi:hypothetical protein